MDVMKFTSEKWTKRLSTAINKWFGKVTFGANVDIHAVQLNFYDDKIHLKLDLDADLAEEEFEKLKKTLGIKFF